MEWTASLLVGRWGVHCSRGRGGVAQLPAWAEDCVTPSRWYERVDVGSPTRPPTPTLDVTDCF